MATTALTHSALEQINSLSQMHIVRQLGFMLILAASIALGTAVVMWSKEADYAVLYPDLSPQDASEVMSALDQGLVDYKIDQRSGMISVPSSELQQTRLQLASLGLPRTTTSGFDVLYEDNSLGTSNFIEQARFTRALEQELVKTIKLIRGVRDARVHLSIPKQSTFLRSSNKASASVMLDVISGQIVNDIQIAGIAHLVASSVSGLDSAAVSIVDQRGTLLSRSSDSEYASSSEHMQYLRTMENDYTQRILDILAPVVGASNVRAQVTADLDFTVVETTEENYDPATAVIRSEQIQQENSGTATSVPGALSATPPVVQADGSVEPAGVDTTAEVSNSRTNSTRNYEIDKSVSYSRTVPGSINRLSVAVLVDLQADVLPAPANDDAEGAVAVDPAQREAEKLARLTQLVKDTIGFNEARGDSVNVISERFSAAPLFDEAAISAPFWEQDWVPGLLKQIAASVVVLLLIFSVLKPALKTVVTQAPPRLANKPAAALAGSSTSPPESELATLEHVSRKAPARSEYDENLTLAQNLVENEPARAARMIKEWVAND